MKVNCQKFKGFDFGSGDFISTCNFASWKKEKRNDIFTKFRTIPATLKKPKVMVIAVEREDEPNSRK